VSYHRFRRQRLDEPTDDVASVDADHRQALRLWLRRLPIVAPPLASRQEHVS
jgi:DUF1365 family protein